MAVRRATVEVGTRSNAEDLIRGFSRIDRRLNEAMYEGTHQGILRLQSAIKSGIPFGSPERKPDHVEHARETWHYSILKTASGGRAISSSDDEISYYYHSGTREHPIHAIRARALRFFWKGRMRSFKSVWHPGTRAHPFVEEGGAQAEAGIKRDFDTEVAEVFRSEEVRP